MESSSPDQDIQQAREILEIQEPSTNLVDQLRPLQPDACASLGPQPVESQIISQVVQVPRGSNLVRSERLPSFGGQQQLTPFVLVGIVFIKSYFNQTIFCNISVSITIIKQNTFNY